MGAATGDEGEFPALEVADKFVPFLFGRDPVFLAGTYAAASPWQPRLTRTSIVRFVTPPAPPVGNAACTYALGASYAATSLTNGSGTRRVIVKQVDCMSR